MYRPLNIKNCSLLLLKLGYSFSFIYVFKLFQRIHFVHSKVAKLFPQCVNRDPLPLYKYFRKQWQKRHHSQKNPTFSKENRVFYKKNLPIPQEDNATLFPRHKPTPDPESPDVSDQKSSFYTNRGGEELKQKPPPKCLICHSIATASDVIRLSPMAGRTPEWTRTWDRGKGGGEQGIKHESGEDALVSISGFVFQLFRRIGYKIVLL